MYEYTSNYPISEQFGAVRVLITDEILRPGDFLCIFFATYRIRDIFFTQGNKRDVFCTKDYHYNIVCVTGEGDTDRFDRAKFTHGTEKFCEKVCDKYPRRDSLRRKWYVPTMP